MRPKIVHEQVVSVVHEEMKCVKHFLVVADQGHLEILVDNLAELRLRLVFLMDKLDLPLLVRLFQQEVGVPDDLVRLLDDLLNVRRLREELSVVLLVVLSSLLGEELLTHISSLIKFLGPQLHINKVSLLQNLVHLIHLFPLELINMSSQLIKKVINSMSDRVAQVELFAVGDHHSILGHLVQFLVDILDEVLGGCL